MGTAQRTSDDLLEGKDNLATELATATTERIGTLMVDLQNLADTHLSEADQRTMVQYAFDAFDGLTQQFREILDDPEHADLWNTETVEEVAR